MPINSPPSDASDGRRILLARRPNRCRELVQLLCAAHWLVDTRAPICFVPPEDTQSVIRAVQTVDDYAWVVFSSPEGVTRWTAASGPRPRRIAAVGPATAELLGELGWTVDCQGKSMGAEALVAAFPDADGENPERVLIVCPEQGRPELPAGLRRRNYRVSEVVFYRTIASAEAGEIAEALSERQYDRILFASPSALHALLKTAGDGVALRNALASMHRVAIGETTARALREEGLPAVVAASPRAGDLFRALVVPSALPEY